MIDNFALALSHGLILLVAWRLVWRRDCDEDEAAPGPRSLFQRRGNADDA